MRILHIATRHRRGGAERNLSFTVRWEIAQGHEVHLAVGPDSLPTEVPIGAVTHLVPDLVREISPLRDLTAFRQLRSLVADGAYDIVHTHQSKAGILGRLAARGRAPVLVHTIHMASFGPAYGRVASALFVIAERWCARFTTRIVAVGNELAAMYQGAGIGTPDRYSVIHSPIDLVAFEGVRSTTPGARRAVRAQFGLAPDFPVALVVASLEPRKRVGLVLETLAPAVRERRLQIAVAGDGPLREQLVARAESLGIITGVRLLGHVEDTAPLMRAADVLVHAATVEGVPQVVIQALAAGLPVAATEMIGLREVENAPVELAHASGDDLEQEVMRALTNPRPRVPMTSLAPWASESIERALADLHKQLAMPT